MHSKQTIHPFWNAQTYYLVGSQGFRDLVISYIGDSDFLLAVLSDVMGKALNKSPLEACSKHSALSPSLSFRGCPQSRFDWRAAVLSLLTAAAWTGSKSARYEFNRIAKSNSPVWPKIENAFSWNAQSAIAEVHMNKRQCSAWKVQNRWAKKYYKKNEN